jgi:serine/threonine protein kinase
MLSDPETPLSSKSGNTVEIGSSIDGYKILDNLATGAQGVVFKAFQQDLGRLVTLKVLNPESVVQAALNARFTREAQVLSRVAHPNIFSFVNKSRFMSRDSARTSRL